MSEFTSTGVVTKTLDEWYNAVVEFKRAVWGQDFVTDPTTKQGADILQLAELLYNAEMNNVSAFAQLNLNTATGICLDYIGLIRGVARDGGYPQEITVDLTSSTTGYTLTPDVAFRTTTGNIYYAPGDIEITQLNQQVVLVYSSDGNPEINEGDALTTVQPYPNVVSAVVAQGGITPGADTEDDASYRKRIKSASVGFVGTLELMSLEMLKIPGMSKLKIIYNDEDTTDLNNVPPYNTEFLVVPQDGADDDAFNLAVADKILDIKVPGAPLNGNTSITVADYYGEQKTVNFTRPSKIQIKFYAKIAANPETKILDTSKVDLEKQSIVDYVQSVEVGDGISWSRVLGMLANDSGFIIVSWGLKKSTDADWSHDDILPSNVREYLWAEIADIDISTTAGPTQ